MDEQHKKLLKKIEKANPEKDVVKTHLRDMVIVPSMVGKKIAIYNGKEFIYVTIRPEMIGHRLGEFAPTRKPVKHSAAGIGATRSTKFLAAK